MSKKRKTRQIEEEYVDFTKEEIDEHFNKGKEETLEIIDRTEDNGGHGFIADEIEDDHYLGGEVGREIGGKKEILNPGGDWRPYLPKTEYQRKNGVETMNCTNYGTYNAIEAINIKRYGAENEINWAERFGGIRSGTTTRGNSPHTVAEILRMDGTIEEKELPFDETITTWRKYYSPKPLTSRLINLGKNTFTDKYDFEHEWVYPKWLSTSQKRAKLTQALERSPIGVAICARYRDRTNDKGYIYKTENDPYNHWCVLVGYEVGKCWYVFDTYDQFVKKLDWDYHFKYAKEYYFKKKPPVYETQADGYIDGRPVPKGSHINGTDMFKWIKKINWNGWPFKQIAGWLNN